MCCVVTRFLSRPQALKRPQGSGLTPSRAGHTPTAEPRTPAQAAEESFYDALDCAEAAAAADAAEEEFKTPQTHFGSKLDVVAASAERAEAAMRLGAGGILE